VYGIGQKKVFEDPWAGLAHAGMVIGFVVPLFFVLSIQFPFTLPSAVSRVCSLVLDLSGLFGMAGVVLAALRRWHKRDEGLTSSWGDGAILGILFGIFLTGFLVGASRIPAAPAQDLLWMPVRFLFSRILVMDPLSVHYLWRLHFLLVAGFFGLVPYCKLRHMVTAPMNAYAKDPGPCGTMDPLRLEPGNTFGASGPRGLNRKQLLDADACMECGRCELQCPATLSGKPLSPRKVMRDLRESMEAERSQTRPGTGETLQEKSLVDRITGDEIWACTTCHACQTACPVFVDQPGILMEMRRHLVLEEARFPAELRETFRRLEIFGDTYGKGRARRMEWARNLKVKVLSEQDRSEVLLWVGCEGAFHTRCREATASLVQVLAKAGVDFGILGREEACCGDLPRRLGNEYLFQRFAQRNLELFHRYGIERIITLCPHCFHALKNEYPQVGGDLSVQHYTEVLADLVRQGRIEMKVPVPGKVVFHDPCYLGRINKNLQAPREVLQSVPNLERVEMDRSLEKAFCCGAGGGRNWMHEHLGKRINSMRAEQAAALDPERVVTGCPYCLGMFEDGISALPGKKKIKTCDLAEIVLLSME